MFSFPPGVWRKIITFFEELFEAAEKIREHPVFVSLRKGVLWSLVPTTIAMIPLFFSISSERDWNLRIMDTYLASLGVMGPSCALLIAHFLCRSYRVEGYAGPVALAVYLSLIYPFPVTGHQTIDALRNTFTSGPFVGFFLAVSLGGLVVFLKKRWSQIGIRAELAALLAGFFFIVTLRYFHQDPHLMIRTFFGRHIARTDTLAAAVLIISLINFLWYFGLQGTAIIGSFTTGVYAQLAYENMFAAARGHVLHHIVTLTFLNYVFIGGAGATFIIPLFMFFARSKKMRVLGEISLLPGIFNINEILIYFVPLVLNSYFLIPFFLSPVFVAVSTFYAIQGGMIPPFSYYIPGIFYLPSPMMAVVGTTPGFFIPRHLYDFHTIFQKIVSSGSWRSGLFSLLQIVCISLLYFPFCRAYDRKMKAEEDAASPSAP